MKKCKICDTGFEPRSIVQIYCSPPCKYEADRRSRTDKPDFKECIYCSKEFKPYTSLDKYCSANCRVDNQKSKRSRNWTKEQTQKRIGKDNPAYRNGNYSRGNQKSAEGEKEYLKVRNGMRARMVEEYGYLFCEKCKTNTTYQWEMHHIVYRSEKPRHEHLHSEKNLINVCMKCHNWYHSKKSRRAEIVEERGLIELFGQDIIVI